MSSDPDPEADPIDTDGVDDSEHDDEEAEKANSTEEDGRGNAAGNSVQLDILPDSTPLPPEDRDNATSANAEVITNHDNDDGDSNQLHKTPNANSESGNDVEAAAAASRANDVDDDDALADTNLRGWFLRHGLPYTDGVCISLDDLGVECVEQLKMIPRDYFLAMFNGEKFIVKETAKLAFEKLNDTPVNLKKCAVGLIEPDAATTAAILSSKRVSDLVPATHYSKRGLASKIIAKKKAHNIKPKVGAASARRRQLMAEANDPLLDGIVRLWNKTGHQNNLLRISVRNALLAGYTKSQIARNVRTRVFGPWDGIGKNCNIFKKIRGTLLRIHTDVRSGKFDDLSAIHNGDQKALMSKSVRPGARGRVKETKVPEKKPNPTPADDSDTSVAYPDPSSEV